MSTKKLSPTEQSLIKPDVVMFLDENRGVYIPKNFVECLVPEIQAELKKCIGESDYNCLLAGPSAENEWYWEAWAHVCDSFELTDPISGVTYTVHQDGDCWLIPVGMEWDEKLHGFTWPDDEEMYGGEE